jgi:nitric oxide dioxygenase
MTNALTSETIATLKATAPALQEHGVAITTRMYERLFQDAEIEKLFDEAAQRSGEQPRRLAAAILAFAKNADNLDAIQGAVDRICARHVATHVKPEHYPAVANALLPAIKDVLGEAATPQILEAWGQAYWFLAQVMIDRKRRCMANEAATSRAERASEANWLIAWQLRLCPALLRPAIVRG